MVTVKISEKGGQKSNYEFDKSEVTIGRMKGNDIVLPKGNVSKKHARIYDRGGSLTVDDLDSTNGTYINGRRVTSEQEISESDKVYIGDFILQVQPERTQAPPDAPPQPPGAQNQSGGGGGRSPSSSPHSDGPGSSEPSSREPSSPPHSGKGGGQSGGSPGGGGGRDPLQDNYNSSQSGPRPRSPDSSRPGERSSGRGNPDDSGLGDQARSSTRRDSSIGGDSSDDRSSGSRERPSSSSPPDEGHERRGARSGRSGRRPDGPDDKRDSDPGGPSPGRSGGRTEEPDSSGMGGGTDSSPSRSPGGSGKRRDDPTSPPDAGSSEPSSDGPSPRDRAPPESSGPSSSAPSRHSTRKEEDEDAGSAPSPPRSRESGGDIEGEDRRRPAHVSIPSPDFRSDFDETFHNHQRSVAEVFLEQFDLSTRSLDGEVDDPVRKQCLAAIRDAIADVDPPVDHDELEDLMLAECVGWGPLALHLEDADVRSIHVNAYDRVVLEHDDMSVRARRAFSHPDLFELTVERLMGHSDFREHIEESRLDDGTLARLIPGSVGVDGPVLTLEKPRREHPDLDTLVEANVLSPDMLDFLEQVAEVGRSILVAGPSEAANSRIFEALAHAIPEGTRIAAIEQTPQLTLPQETVFQLQTPAVDGVDSLDVVEAAEAMRADRVLLNPCRGREALGWIRAAAGGTHGNLATIDAVGAADALKALVSACSSARAHQQGLQRRIARAVDLVVVVAPSEDGTERIHQISEVRGVELDTFQLEDVFYFDDEDGMGGDFESTGYVPLFYEDLRHAGFEVDLELFRE